MGRKGGWNLSSLIRQRTLIGAEAVLVVGILQQLLSQRLAALTMPNGVRILIIMAMVLGVIGGVVVLAKGLIKVGVEHTHSVAKALPLPMATVLAHLVAFCGLFLLYAVIWHLPVAVPFLGTVGESATR